MNSFLDHGVGERIRLLRGGESQAEFAEKFGISKSTLARYERSEGQPDADLLLRFCERFKISPGWLLAGVGEKDVIDTEVVAKTPHNYAIKKETIDQDEFVLVPRYDVKASTGPGSIVASEQIVDFLAFKRPWINSMHLSADQLALISAKGDSMEPTIKDGYLLLVDLRQKQATSDAIYVIRFDHELIAKRLQLMFGGSIKIKSDNPAYDEQIVGADQVSRLNIIGRVVWGGGRM